VKKGANGWCFPSDWSLEQSFDLARKAGFDGVEINLEEKGEFSLESSKDDIVIVRNLATKYEMELPSISTSLFWKYPLTSLDNRIRNKGKDIAKRMIESASYLDIDTILVVPGVVNEETSYDTAYDRSQEALNELGDFAAKQKVTIGVENVWNKFLLSPLEMKQFIDEIDHPAVGVYFDVGNVLVSGFPEQWIRILGSHIKKVHVKDFKTEVGNITGFTSLLQGDVRWKEVQKALGEIGYDGYLTSEIPAHRSYPEQSLYEISQALDLIIQG
jgi:L-ribulose-5-phosphate 3-epimerase